jgi:hypothetical protein
MGQILLGLFAAYLLYNFVFRFLIPLIKVTRQVRRQVRDFQQQANAHDGIFQGGATHNGGFQSGGNTSGQFRDGSFRVEDLRNNAASSSYSNNASTTSTRQEPSPKKDDYIDFEEIK